MSMQQLFSGTTAASTRRAASQPSAPAADAAGCIADVGTQLLKGESHNGVIQLVRRDVSTFAGVDVNPGRDDEGRLVENIGTSSDVSAGEKAKAALERAHRTAEEALALLETLQGAAPAGFAFVDRDLRFVRVNEELASMMGTPIHEIVGRLVVEVAPELWEQLAPAYRRVLDTGQAVRNEPVVSSRDTVAPRETLASCYPIRIGDEIVGVGTVVVDITERVRAEQLRSALMSQVEEGVYSQDGEGRLMFMNGAASRMLGWTEGELRGKRMHELVHSQTTEESPVCAGDCALLTQNSGGRLERSAGEAFTRKDGSIFPVAYSAVPLRTGSTFAGVSVVFRDVSEPGSRPNVIRVLIADDDKATVQSFQALLNRHDGIEVVGVAPTSLLASEGVRRLKPDVVLVNYELPDGDGLATARTIKADAPSTHVILMTARYDDGTAMASIDAGCAGVLDKGRAWVELVSAVRAAYHGETIISQEELHRVLAKARDGEQAGRAMQLTDREEEVLACLREGLPNSQVAERLGVAPNTVRNHVARILYKLNVHSKLEAVVATFREGV